MQNRLIDYRPEFEAESVPPLWDAHEQELGLAADLLSALHEGRLQPFLLGMGGGLPGAPAVAGALLPLARRVFAANGQRSSARMFGMELEGLSPEDKRFELARQFIRFSRHAFRRARQLARGDPRQVARAALAQAARQHAPGLLPYLGIVNGAAAAVPLSSSHFNGS